ncbi:deoxyguanosinetriphosphate triphosphohydrolase [Bacillus amyloliquefaciens]|uniref:deoxyguanosinetriphosphate triphosphohydrolase n=2 Tax=Bacillus subtilis group TaxID=653685 RepID=UPI00084A04BB|nr:MULTISPECIES: deoxyguanosinetriphosphate triphosphohydrolase [Bacillus amyloliquefaciens group]AOO63553.1 deoxyguanosinetriphosphate triphosphohydrolase [Bacillus velezensis]APB84194.1 deoxyguanosinetriphosphate triphosphohydrolase [Bacillus amyloliquefaciens]AWM84958.1 deoxyguanosinetriphosphate triphosphohydrolase [Bacillus velezensis]MCT6828884.1 deoxyguanosinetriphosphate triphosphohydrolase [Bacillus velezensis]MCT6863833.1 deoxyguanosinetriphosphate triphosphohydrolase [Bacillus velez
MLEWDQLLNTERQRESLGKSLPHRNEFDKDYERIIYSSSLRRLQDKAQVFPLQNNDFIRTRLTHSLEVASLGRSLAWNIGSWLIEEKVFPNFERAKELASLVEVSCLVHDLGNPPFGHYGEDIIRKWFEKWFNSTSFEKAQQKFGEMDEQQKNDFLYFEGNAQAIRILSKLQFLNDPFGANFTYGTLATLMKYPWASNHDNVTKQGKKKFGYFYAEKDLFEKLSSKVGIGICRHPATYILEAADDIAYLTADIEDAVKKGVFTWEEEYMKLKEKFNKKYESVFKKLEEYRRQAIENKVPNKSLIDVQNFKVSIQGIMIFAVVESFKTNYHQIMSGEFDGDLLSTSSANEIADDLRNLAFKYVFSNKEVLTLELVGDRVISDLLSLFIEAVTNVNGLEKSKSKHEKLIHLISENFRHIQRFSEAGKPEVDFSELTLYNRLLLVTDFISGMTDGYAVNLHQELLGVKLP